MEEIVINVPPEKRLPVVRFLADRTKNKIINEDELFAGVPWDVMKYVVEDGWVFDYSIPHDAPYPCPSPERVVRQVRVWVNEDDRFMGNGKYILFWGVVTLVQYDHLHGCREGYFSRLPESTVMAVDSRDPGGYLFGVS